MPAQYFLDSWRSYPGRRGHFEYNDSGRATRFVDPAGGVVVRTYDSEGRLASITNSTGASTRYEHNDNGLLAQEIDALGGATKYQYDDAGRLIELIVAKTSRWRSGPKFSSKTTVTFA